MNINNFKSGDLIVRTEPAEISNERYNDNLGISVSTPVLDYSYIGDPLKLLDVCNGMIYYEVIGSQTLLPKKREMNEYRFSEGWNYFVVPDGFTLNDFINQSII